MILLSITDAVYFMSRLGLQKLLKAAGMKVIAPAAFESGKFSEAKTSEIRRLGVRVVSVLAWEKDIIAIASANQGAGWAWVQIEKIGSGTTVMAGWLTIVGFLHSVPEGFANQVSDYSEAYFNITVLPELVHLAYSAALYDAIMLYAHAATRVLSEGGNLRDGEAVTATTRNTVFMGVGRTVVALDSSGDRIASYEVMNYVVGPSDVMSIVAVGLYNSSARHYRAYERPVVWPGNTTEVPADYFSGELR